MNGPSSSRGNGTVAAWVSCAILAAAAHAAWWRIAPSPPAPTHAGRPPAPRVSFMSPEQFVRGTDVRVLWSPKLFAVPSSLGFSGSLLGERIAFGPRARVAAPRPFLVERAPAWGVGMATPAEETLAALVRGSASSLPVRAVAPSPVFASRPSSTSIVLHITWTDQSGVSRNVSVDVGRVDPWVDPKPWQAGALLDVDMAGSVRHVFLETPTSLKDRNAALVRVLSTLRLERGPARSSRVRVRYEGSYTGTEEAGP
ncbi:MAG TPA: hypothetical protein VIH35_06935 [Kiritimatiellia bacterium]